MQDRAFIAVRVAGKVALVCACAALFLVGCQDGGKSFRRALRGAATNPNQARGMFNERPKAKQGKKQVDSSDGKTSIDAKKKKEKRRITNKDAIISCPKKARLAGSPPPRGTSQWCEARDEGGKVVKHGGYRKWHKNGTLKESGNFDMGLPHGVFVNRGGNGIVVEERQFKDGQAHGLRVKYDKSGTRRTLVSYFEGAKHGKYIKWTKDGVQRERGVFYLDQKHGEWYSFHRNGQIKKLTTYFQGKKRGPTEKYSKDGVLVAVGEFHDNVQVNRWATFFNDGTPKSEGTYRDGQKHGAWITYKKGGAIRKSAVYDQGVVIQQSSPKMARARGKRNRGLRRGKPFGKGDILGAEPPRQPVTPPIRPKRPSVERPQADEDGGWQSM